MKFLMSALLVFASYHGAFAQKIDSATMAKLSPEKQQEVKENLRQAKNAKTTAVLLAMGGGSIAFAGIAYSIAYDINNTYALEGPSYNDGTKVAILGAMVGLSSIPFFIKSHNKRDAARVMLYTDNNMRLAPQVSIPGSQSSGVRLVVPLGR